MIASRGGQRNWRGRPWEDAALLELHVGTFTPGGSFRAAIERLDHVVDTGLTAIELMPLADFSGRRNWGYDGVLLYAPDSAYGRPDDFKALIDAAHLRGLMVFLDVVYNHFGPEGNYRPAMRRRFSPTRIRHGAARSTIAFRKSAILPSAMRCIGCSTIVSTGYASTRCMPLSSLAGRRSWRSSAARSVEFAARAAGCSTSCSRTTTTARACSIPHRPAARQISRAMERRLPPRLARSADRRTQGLLSGLRLRLPRRILRACSRPALPTRARCRHHRGGRRRGEPSGALPPAAFVEFLQNHDQIGNRPFGDRLARKSTRRRSRPLSPSLCSPRCRR